MVFPIKRIAPTLRENLALICLKDLTQDVEVWFMLRFPALKRQWGLKEGKNLHRGTETRRHGENKREELLLRGVLRMASVVRRQT